MRIPSPGDMPRRRAHEVGGRRARTVVVSLALALGLVLGVLLAGPGGVGKTPAGGSSAQVERLSKALSAAAEENAALARLLRSRRSGDLTLATPGEVRLVDATSSAVNDTDVDSLRRLFAPNAVFTDLATERVTHGAAAIALAYGQLDEPHLERTTAVFEVGGRVVWAHATGVCVGDVSNGRFRELVLLPRRETP